MSKIKHDETQQSGLLYKVIGSIKKTLIQLFEPEEVEVTFIEEGTQIKYTYTKVQHKGAA
jgi:hypothetical protein